MKNSITITIPDFVTQAFPILKEMTYVREFSSFITLYPDAVYYLFQTADGQSFILEELFFVSDPNGHCCYYLAAAKRSLDW